MSYPVIDLHSDLLSFLSHREGRSVDDPHSRNSFGQMLSGNVMLQTLAIFSKTGAQSVAQGKKQIACFEQLLRTQEERCFPVQLIAAFENASAFASEEEPLTHALARLQEVLDTLGQLFYITMTWDGENRFGGGVGSQAGLKEDGKQLLQWLSGKKVAIDLSHTSDKLAAEILEHIDKRSLTVPVIASHSNFRKVTQMPRNLPDAIASEIIRRKGLIGINLFAPFIDRDDPNKLLDHFAHGLALGGADALCFGADFFCESDFPSLKEKYRYPQFFFDAYSDSSTYPHILQLLEKELKLSSELLQNISHKNASSFLYQSQLKKS